MTEKGKELLVVKAPLELTEESIQAIQYNIKMAQKLVVGALEKDIDYGRTPGIPTDSLWDPGAAKIMAAFNCYSSHQILYHTEEDNLISWCIEAQIISRESQQVIATGVGAASTRETKYKYRWVDKPEDFGYDLEQIKKLKTKRGDRGVLFRIQNPEYGELANTLFQMAAKRAEVDGTKSLPGVGSALKKLFTGSIKDTRKEPDWAGFWGRVAQIGISQQRAHEILEVTSLNQWIAQGKTLDQAIETITRKLSQKEAAETTEEKTPDDITEEDVPDLNALFKLCNLFFKVPQEREGGAPELVPMQPLDVCKELGYTTTKEALDSGLNPWEAWLTIKGFKRPQSQELPDKGEAKKRGEM